MTELQVKGRTPQLDEFVRLGQWLAWAETGRDDEKSKVAGAALRFYYARELGLSPLAASELSVINGRLVVGAALLRALALRAGYRVIRSAATDQACTARLVQVSTGEVLGDATFTLDDAKRAGLIRDKGAWKTHPARMLWARASKNVIVDFAPEVALGITLDDELLEQPGAPAVDSDLPWAADPPDAQVVDPDVERAEQLEARLAARGPDYRPPPDQQPLPDPPDDDEPEPDEPEPDPEDAGDIAF
jgi:hypothetical protein